MIWPILIFSGSGLTPLAAIDRNTEPPRTKRAPPRCDAVFRQTCSSRKSHDDRSGRQLYSTAGQADFAT